MHYLLIEPEFPISTKSKNHKNFLPIGLLKIAAMLENQGHIVLLVRGNRSLLDLFVVNHEINSISKKKKKQKLDYKPDEIWITSLFTYWINDVKKSVTHYKTMFPDSTIVVGGIAASLFGEEKTKELTSCDRIHVGVIPDAENISTKKMKETYKKFLGEIDFQIMHTQRGCFRRCKFCGTWKIEPIEINEKTIKEKIFKRNLVFYDNNFLRNPFIHNILDELIELKKKRKIGWCESQSGFDGRLIIKDPYLVGKLKLAGFRNIRIAWDDSYKSADSIKKQINILTKGKRSFARKELEIFMLYNWDIGFNEMEKKRVKCFEWGVQISDCRFRPLDQAFDNYNPRKLGQTNNDYYIHSNWNDFLVKQFRRNVRRHNICVRRELDFYCKLFERKSVPKETFQIYQKLKIKEEKRIFFNKNNLRYWDPSISDKKIDVNSANKNKKNLRLLH